MKKRIAVLISNGGTGTNLQGLIDGVESGVIKNGEISVVISDTPEALGLERAKKHGIETYILKPEDDLTKILKDFYKVDFIGLGGWKKIIPDSFLKAFEGRVLNIHPGLIPDSQDGVVLNPDGTHGLWNKGKYTRKAVENFLDSKATYAGSSAHLLTEKFDFGPVLERCFEKIKKGDTVDTLYPRLKEKENKIFAIAMNKLCEGWGQKTVLVTDAGGRGAVLVEKYAKSPWVKRILAVPGNDLMQINSSKEVKTFPALKTTDVREIIKLCLEEKVDLVDVAQDNAVEAGLADALELLQIPYVGPKKLPGQIEWDKSWARDFMKKYGIPIPEYKTFKSVEEGEQFLKNHADSKWFVKAAGLALGKGVIPADTNEEAIEAIKRLKEEFKYAASNYLLEEWLDGEEFSSFAISDGKNFKIVGHAQDNKRIGNFDTGENTGGIGANNNPLLITPEIEKQIYDIFEKTLKGLKEEGREYKGVLYLGGTICDERVLVIEFNARWGDPEGEVTVPSIQYDLYELGEVIYKGGIKEVEIKQDTLSRVLVTACAKGYPGDYSGTKNKQLFGLDKVLKIDGVKVYSAGVKKEGEKILVNGGRVLHIVGEGKDIIEAREKAYQAISCLSIEGNNLYYRTDIGWRDIERLRNPKKMEIIKPSRIEVLTKQEDTRALVKKRKIEGFGYKDRIESLELIDVYTIDKELSLKQIKEAASTFTNPVTQKYRVIAEGLDKTFSNGFDWAIEIGFLPGVSDNVGNTAKQEVEDLLKLKFKQGESVYSSVIYLIKGKLSREEIEKIAEGLANNLIQRIHIKSYEKYLKDSGMDLVVPKVDLHKEASIIEVNLNVSDEELIKIGKLGIQNPDGTRRGPLALDLLYMKTIQNYFKKMGRNPTDIELESLAQTWSEHCKHTIFADPLDELKDGLFKTYIKGATEKVRKLKGKKDNCVSVFTDNSGAIDFDGEYLITHKVETHNSPSALDPFGGAITGIVGVNRDTLGFGMGAKPIANFYGFCVGDPNDMEEIYKDEALTAKMLSPRRILDGVIEGINSGGNCSGIPTPQGFLYFDDKYKGKPLVFAGTLGLMPKANGKPLYIKKAVSGDYIVMIGGRVGLDGIHGATFSSQTLDSTSPAAAVQIGDPITQKKLSDALVKEARDLNLYHSITDDGAGGLSCSVSEMAKECGGALVYLDRVPLKYPGLDPWQIWISESQERMTLSIPKNKWKIFADLMEKRGVEATVIGEFTNSGRCEVLFNNKKIMDIDLVFLHNGLPKRKLTSQFTQIKHKEPEVKKVDIEKILTDLIGRLNVASSEFISTQYDHEVQGTSVVKPIQGKGRVVGEVAVLKPLLNSEKGIVTSFSVYPSYADIDTYHMASAAIDTAIRNIVSGGAEMDTICLLDNFCWCSSFDPQRLGQLKRAVRACFDLSVDYQAPFISGKDSMFNDFSGFDKKGNSLKISIPPTLLISSVGIIDDVKKAVTLDFKQEGDLIYLLGETFEELGGSEYYQYLSDKNGGKTLGNSIPIVNPLKNKRLYKAIEKAIDEELLSASFSLGRGGLGVGLLKMAMAGKLGAQIYLKKVGGKFKREDLGLFSESMGRVLVTIDPKKKQEFEKSMGTNPFSQIGVVTDDSLVTIFGLNQKEIGKINLEKSLESYKKTFKGF